MAKKIKKDKELLRLRRQVEALKAQLAERGTGGVKGVKGKEGLEGVRELKEGKNEAAEFSCLAGPYLKGDLFRTFSLAFVSLAIIFSLYLTQSQWPQALDKLSSALQEIRLSF